MNAQTDDAVGVDPPLLVVPYNKQLAWKMLGGGLVLAGLAGSQFVRLMTKASVVAWILAIVGGLLAALLLLVAVAGVTRRRPALVVTGEGIAYWVTNSVRTLVPWSQFAGVETVGKGDQTHLVVTVLDPEAAIVGMHKAVVGGVRSYNNKHNLPGAIYVPANMLARPVDAVAGEIRSLALQQIDAKATT